jgi:hypothetical protein
MPQEVDNAYYKSYLFIGIIYLIFDIYLRVSV